MDHTDHPAKRRRLSAYKNGAERGKGAFKGEQGYALDGGDLNHGSIENTKEGSSEEISISSTSKLARQNVAPFLAQHIPEQYAPVGATSTMAEAPQRTMNSRYCYRHRPDLKCRRKADEPSMDQMQHELESLSQSDQQGIAHVWTLFSAAPAKHRQLMLQGILTQCCFPQLSYLSGRVRELIRIDFLSALPTELGFKILCYLDTTSLCKAAQVSQRWRSLADDDVVWHRMCEQHIDRKCTRCGWGLPLLERKRLRASKRQIQLRSIGKGLKSPDITPEKAKKASQMNLTQEDLAAGPSNTLTNDSRSSSEISLSTRSKSIKSASEPRCRPWKDVYKDRFKVGSNWKHGRYSTTVLKGHTNGVMCLQFDDHILATGSYDATIKIWDIETGRLLRTLHGHTSGIRALQFDSTKLISGSIDKSLKIWNWRTGECLSMYTGHSGGIIGLHFDNQFLASGSVDRSVRIWNFEDKSTFVLNGHEDWVNAVRVDSASRTVLSASDDCTVRLWDLDTKTTIKTYKGHVGQVQQVLPLPMEFDFEEGEANDTSSDGDDASTNTARETSSGVCIDASAPFPLCAERAAHLPRYMITGGLDNTIRLWDVQSARCLRTYFGHVEGIWALAADSLRIVSGSEDRTVKVWDARSGKCERNFAGHAGPVTCVGLSDSRVVTGGEDCEVRIYSFKGPVPVPGFNGGKGTGRQGRDRAIEGGDEGGNGAAVGGGDGHQGELRSAASGS